MKKIVFCILCFLLVNGQVIAKTKLELLNEIRALSRDNMAVTSQQYLSTSLLETRMDAAQVDIVKSSLCLSTYTHTTTVASQSQYSIPSDMLVLTKVCYNGTIHSTGSYKRLEFTTQRKLDIEIPGWESTAAGTPTRFFLDGNQVTLYPKPLTSAFYVRMDYTPRPLLLSTLGDSGDPFVVGTTTYKSLLSYHDLITYYVVNLNKIQEGSVEANYYSAKYINGLSTMIAEFNATPDRQGQILYTPK